MNPDSLAQGFSRPSAAPPASGDKLVFFRRRTVVAGLVVCFAAAASLAYDQYRKYPLRHLPRVDLSGAPAAVKLAIENARKQVIAAPRSGAAWGQLGLFLRAHEFDSEANVCLAQAMRFDPRQVLWPYVRGSSLSVRDRAEAERCFRQAAGLRPDLALPRLRLAELFLEDRRLDLAEAEFHAALDVEPNSARAMLGLGLIAFTRGNVDAAQNWAEKSFAADSGQRTTVELLLRVYYRQGNKPAAARQQALLDKMPLGDSGWDDPFREKVQMFRRDPGGRAEVAGDLLNQGRLPEAIDELEQLVESAPETAQWHLMLAQALIRQKNFRRAAQVLDAALVRHPHSADLHFRRGVVHFFERQWEPAAAEFEQASQLKPDFSDAFYNLGHTRKNLHDSAGAIAAFRSAIRFRPDYATAYINLGELLWDEGDRDGAREALATARRITPEDEQLKRLTEQLETPETD